MRNAKGFTLMEIMVAMVLLASVASMAFSSFASSQKVIQNQDSLAYFVARWHLDRFYEFVRQDQYAPDTPSPLSLNGRPAPANVVLDTTYTAAYTLNNSAGAAAKIDANGNGQEDYRTVNLVISW